MLALIKIIGFLHLSRELTAAQEHTTGQRSSEPVGVLLSVASRWRKTNVNPTLSPSAALSRANPVPSVQPKKSKGKNDDDENNDDGGDVLGDHHSFAIMMAPSASATRSA